jgi:hypothetical protein
MEEQNTFICTPMFDNDDELVEGADLPPEMKKDPQYLAAVRNGFCYDTYEEAFAASVAIRNFARSLR